MTIERSHVWRATVPAGGQSILAAALSSTKVYPTLPASPNYDYDWPMRWLLHGTLTQAAADALRRHGHEVSTLEQAGLSSETEAPEVLATAHKKQLDLMTTDSALANTPFDGAKAFDRSIVLMNVEAGDVEQDDAIDRLFARYKRLSPGRLYTVTGSRVKIRQLPSGR